MEIIIFSDWSMVCFERKFEIIFTYLNLELKRNHFYTTISFDTHFFENIVLLFVLKECDNWVSSVLAKTAAPPI